MWCTSQNGIVRTLEQLSLSADTAENVPPGTLVLCIRSLARGTTPFPLVYIELKFHARREQYLLLSMNFKASFPAQCGVCNSSEV